MNDEHTISQPSPLTPCTGSRRFVLDMGWSETDRQQAAEALAHIANCPACRASVEEFDQTRSFLSAAVVEEPGTDESTEKDWVERALQSIPQAKLKAAVEMPRRTRPSMIPFLRIAAAASLAAGIGFGGYWIGQRVGNGRSNSTPDSMMASASGAAHIEPAELANRVAAFEQVAQTLDRRAEWLLVSDKTSDVGIAAAPTVDRHVLVVRLAVTARNDPSLRGGDAPAQIISSADLAILPGRTARLSLPFSAGRTLSYQISAGPDDPMRLALFAELLPRKGNETRAAEPLAAIATTLDLRSDSAASAGTFETTAGQYELTVGFSKAELAQGTP